MKTRVITAAVLIAVLIPVLVFSSTPVYPAFFLLLTVIGLFELFRCVGQQKNLVATVPCYLLAAVFLASTRYFPADKIAGILGLSSFFVMAWQLCVSVFSGEGYKVTSASLVGVMTVYICFGFSSLVFLRDIEGGEVVFLLPFLLPWISDSFAYFSGRAFGKHKLIPEVSPKKTVEGAVGALVCTPLIALLYGFIVSLVTDYLPNYPLLAIAGVVVSAISQCGDLIASLIKRQFGIKDYSSLFPGHGGVLDRFDSVLITGPFLLIIHFVSMNMTFFHR